MSFDLHTHSRWSDGTTTPQTNAALAVRAGLCGVALTDHDTVHGWPQMAEACAHHGIEFVPGVELSAYERGARPPSRRDDPERGARPPSRRDDPERGRSVHLLGYWVDPDDEPLARQMARLRITREDRVARMLEKLRRAGIGVTLDHVRAVAGRAPLGRPHVAAALVEIGAVPDVRAAFDRLLGEDRLAYVPHATLMPEQAVTLIVAAGGVAVLAHPGRSGVGFDLLDRLAGAGMAAVEAFHPHHAEEVAVRWERAARERGLLVTGSSDFHGARKAVTLGERTTSDRVVEALRARKRQEVRSW